MIKNHTDANEKLKNVASQLHLTVPSALLPEHAHHKAGMAKLKGPAFDKSYMKMMVEHYKDDVEEFNKASNSNNNLIKDFASQTLPVLTKHLDSANAIYNRTE